MADTPKPNTTVAPPVMPQSMTSPPPKGFSRQNVIDMEQNVVIQKSPSEVQAAVPQKDGGFKLTSEKLDPANIDFSKIDPKDFYKLVGTGIFDAVPLSMPDFLSGIKLKDKNYIVVGVNYQVEGGTRVSQFKAAGHQFITKDELEEPIPFDVAVGDPQGVKYKDLCFMKVQVRKHLQNMESIYQATQAQSGKKNMQRALQQRATNIAGTDTIGKYGNVFFIPTVNNENGPHSALPGGWAKAKE